jgi:hypothetical protein
MCIPTSILTPRLGNNFSLNIAGNINPTNIRKFQVNIRGWNARRSVRVRQSASASPRPPVRARQ